MYYFYCKVHQGNVVCSLYRGGPYRPVVRLIERGVHVKNMQASGHKTYNRMRFKLSTLVLNNLKFGW